MAMDKEKLLILTKDKDKENEISDRGNKRGATIHILQPFQASPSTLILTTFIKIPYLYP